MWNKQGKANFDIATVIILIVIGIVAWNSGLLGLGKPQTQVQPNGQESVDSVIKVVGGTCAQGTTLTNTLRRRYTEASASGENTTVFANGARLAIVGGGGGTTTVQSGTGGQELDLYVAEDLSTTYYTQHAKGKITECTAAASTGEDKYFKLVKDSSPGGEGITYSDAPAKLILIADTAVTIDITNDGQSNAQSGTNELTGENLSIGTGGTGSVTLGFKVPYNTGWGAIGGNILACQYPSAVYDSANPIIFTVGGKVLESADVSVPSQRFVLIQNNNTVKTWKFPGIDGRLTPTIPGSAIIRASSNNDPQSILDRFNCTTFDTDYYQKQTGEFVVDIVNRDTNADLGGANTLFDFVIATE